MRASSVIVAGSLIAAGLVLGACREQEQDRVLLYEKGTYLGQPDTALSEETRMALRQRSQFQRTTPVSAAPGGGGSASGAAPGVAPRGGIPHRAARTGMPDAIRDALRARARQQRY